MSLLAMYCILQKLFILLLHFPAMMFYDPCYPTLFLYGWDHYYLDAIDQTNKSTLIDIRCVPQGYLIEKYMALLSNANFMYRIRRQVVVKLCVN